MRDPSDCRYNENTLVLKAGRWQIDTVGSTYIVDIEGRTAVRLPRSARLCDYTIAHLRRDGEHLPLLAEPRVALGQSMTLALQVREDGPAITLRVTTPVIAVTQLPSLGSGS